MNDILSFNTFIAPYILLFFYYIGAVVIPIFLWLTKDYFLKKVIFLQTAHDNAKNLYHSLSREKQLFTILLFVMLFLMMELFWRLMFEAMIGYFDMHNYLYEIMKNLK